jgi:hypothetical protein
LVKLNVDDRGEAYVDGKLLIANLGGFKEPLRLAINSTNRCLAVHVTNRFGTIGLIMEPSSLGTGTVEKDYLMWKCTSERQADLSWTRANFDDSSWPQSVRLTENNAWNVPPTKKQQFSSHLWWIGVQQHNAEEMFCRRRTLWTFQSV